MAVHPMGTQSYPEPPDAPQRSARAKVQFRLLRWASGIMLMLGFGHLLVLLLIDGRHVTAWLEGGPWAAVPLVLTGANATKTIASLQNETTFWAGPGSFAAPLILLGCLIWNLARRQQRVPAGIGWGVVAWCIVGGVLLVPSPFFLGAIAGLLIIAAGRARHQNAAARHDQSGDPNRRHPPRA